MSNALTTLDAALAFVVLISASLFIIHRLVGSPKRFAPSGGVRRGAAEPVADADGAVGAREASRERACERCP